MPDGGDSPTRQRLLVAGARVFAQKGYAGAVSDSKAESWIDYRIRGLRDRQKLTSRLMRDPGRLDVTGSGEGCSVLREKAGSGFETASGV